MYSCSPSRFPKRTTNQGRVCWLQPLSLSVDRAHLHTGVNINVSGLGMFLEHRGLLKHCRDGPRVLLNLTSVQLLQRWKNLKPWNRNTSIDLWCCRCAVACCKRIFSVWTFSGLSPWESLFRRSLELAEEGAAFNVKFPSYLYAPLWIFLLRPNSHTLAVIEKVYVTGSSFSAHYWRGVWVVRWTRRWCWDCLDGAWYVVLFHLTPTPKSVTCNVGLEARWHTRFQQVLVLVWYTQQLEL